jgi:hypothetical protein
LLRLQRAPIVCAVGHQDDVGPNPFSAAVALRLFESRQRHAQPVADRRAIFDHADSDPSKLACEPVVVERQRRHRIGAAGEEHDADADPSAGAR